MKKTLLLLAMVFVLAVLPMMTVSEEVPETLNLEELAEEIEEEITAFVENEAKALITVETESQLQMEMVYQYMPSIKPVQGTGYLTMESKKDNSLGLFASTGEQLISYGHTAINYLNYDFFSARRDKDAVNGMAIYRGDGTQISDYVYGTVTVYDSHWIAGTILLDADGNNDVTVDRVNYQIGQWDLYYVTEDAADSYLVASLSRAEYAEAKQHGDYISIKDRDGNVTVYDRSFQMIPVEVKDVKAAYYRIENYQVISNLTNEVIASGYSEVREADLPGRMVLICATTLLNGVKNNTILDLDGSLLMPPDYTVVTLGDPYVVVANADGLRGLYSLVTRSLVVPCEYSNIVASTTSTDAYVNNGYVCVEKDGKRGYVEAATGVVSCPVAFNSRVARTYGCSIVFDGEDGYVLIAADGTRTSLYEYEEVAATRGDGYLLVAKKDGFYGLIDWHGNVMLPFIHKNVITITDDSKAMLRTSTGLELDVITAR